MEVFQSFSETRFLAAISNRMVVKGFTISVISETFKIRCHIKIGWTFYGRNLRNMIKHIQSTQNRFTLRLYLFPKISHQNFIEVHKIFENISFGFLSQLKQTLFEN